MNFRNVAVLGLFAVMATACANRQVAQPAPDTQPATITAPTARAQAYLKSAALDGIVSDLVIRWDRDHLGLQSSCKGSYDTALVSTGVTQLLEFSPGSFHPGRGMWVSRYALTRCGATKLYNVLLVARKNNLPQAIPLVPGNTLASPQLLQDLYLQGVALMVAVKGEDRQCARGIVTDTKVTMAPAELEIDGERMPGVWEENWTVKHCSETIDVTFCLVPDGLGGTDWSTRACSA